MNVASIVRKMGIYMMFMLSKQVLTHKFVFPSSADL